MKTQEYQQKKAEAIKSRDAALSLYGDMVAAQWGEEERAAGIALKVRSSHALILNAIAVYDIADVDTDLSATARKMFTAADKKELRHGG